MNTGIVLASIGSIYVRDNCISSGDVSTWIRCAVIGGDYIKGICAKGAFVEDIAPKALAGSKIILGSQGVTFTGVAVNDCCFQLSMGWVFASIDGVSY